jgi:uncharacterized membrane protein YkoI
VRRLFPTLSAAAVAVMAVLAPASAGESECYNDWSIAAQIVENEKLVTVDKITAGAKASKLGDIVKTTLCKEDGKYVFRLVVRDKGTLKTVTLDAREPFKK